jgi:hypothetical protein
MELPSSYINGVIRWPAYNAPAAVYAAYGWTPALPDGCPAGSPPALASLGGRQVLD